MNVGFDNIFQHTIPMNDFQLKWRFTEVEYDKLPKLHLEQLKPLNDEASQFLWDYIAKTNLHSEVPFKKDFWQFVEEYREGGLRPVHHSKAYKEWNNPSYRVVSGKVEI